MSKETENTEPKRKKWLKYLGIILGSLLVIIFTATAFFVDEFITYIASDFVRFESKGVYKLNVEDLDIDIIDNHLIISDLSLIPDTVRFEKLNSNDSLKNNLYEIKLKKLIIRDLNLKKLYFENELVISKIEIEKPQLLIAGKISDTNKKPHKKLQEQVESIQKKYLKSIIIDEVDVNDGMFDIYSHLSDSTHKTSIGKISVFLQNFSLGDYSDSLNKRLMFSEKIELIFDDISFNFFETSTKLNVDEIKISSLDSSIQLSNLDLSSLGNKDSKEAETKFNVPVMRLSHVDVERLVFDTYLESDSLYMKDVYVRKNLSTPPGNKVKIKQLKDLLPDRRTIYETVAKVLSGVDIKFFEIEESELTLTRQFEKFFDISEIDFIISNILLDSACVNKAYKLIIGEDAEVNLKGLEFVVRDMPAKQISVADININTKSETVNIAELILYNERKSNVPVYNTMIDGLSVNDVNFYGVFNTSQLEMGLIKIEKPNLDFKIFFGATAHKDSVIHFAEMLEIGSIDVLDGQYNIELNDTVRKTKFTLNGRLNEITLTDLLYNSADTLNNRLAFREISGSFENSRIELPDSSKSLSFEELKISSEDSLFRLSRFEFLNDTELTGDHNLFDVYVDSIILTGIEILNAIKNKTIVAKDLAINQPNLNIKNKKNNKKFKAGDLNTALLSIRDEIKVLDIGSIDINNFSIDYYKSDKDLIWLKEKDFINLDMFGFNLREIDYLNIDKPFFCDSIILGVTDYQLYSEKSGIRLDVKSILMNTNRDETHLDSIVVQLASPDDKQPVLHLDLNKISFSGVDYEAAFFEHKVIVDNILFRNPNLKINGGMRKEGTGNNKFHFQLPENLSSLKINDLNFVNGNFSLDTHDSVSMLNGSAGFDIRIDNVFLDSLAEFTLFRDSLFFDDVEITLSNINSLYRDSIYSITADTFNVSLKDHNIKVENFNLNPLIDSVTSESLQRKGLHSTAKLHIPYIHLNEIDFQGMMTGSGLKVNSVQFGNTGLDLYAIKKENVGTGKLFGPLKRPAIKLPKPIHYIHVSDLSIANFDFYMNHFIKNDSSKSFTINDLTGLISDIVIDTIPEHGDEKFLFSADIKIMTDSYHFYSKDSMYSISAKNLALSTGNSSITMDSLRVKPRYGLFEFGEKLGYQTDRMDLAASKLKVRGFDFISLFYKGAINAGLIRVDDFAMNSFRDKSLPFPEWINRPMPQEMVKSIPFPINIDTVLLRDGNITYGERLKSNTNNVGSVDLNRFQAKVLNISNDLSTDFDLIADANFHLYDTGFAIVHLTLPMNSDNDTVVFYGESYKMDLSIFNPLSENLFGVSIKKGRGRIKGAHFHGNKQYMLGHIEFPYKRFKIQLIDKKTGKTGGIGSGILSFLANEIFLKSNNPKFARKTRIGEVYFRRDDQKSIFNYLWKSLLSGIESTLGYNTREQRKEKKEFRERINEYNSKIDSR